jgi:hypothetical protein
MENQGFWHSEGLNYRKILFAQVLSGIFNEEINLGILPGHVICRKME